MSSWASKTLWFEVNFKNYKKIYFQINKRYFQIKVKETEEDDDYQYDEEEYIGNLLKLEKAIKNI